MASETPLTDDNVLFKNIDGEQKITEIESYCMNCGDNGTTRMLLTVIPHFREVVVMAFDCPHCGFRNNEVQPAAALAELGVHQTIRVDAKEELSRQVVKSESASVRFEELDFEIPAQKGVLTTIEGLLQSAIEGLSQNQDERKVGRARLFALHGGHLSCSILLRTDPSNSIDQEAQPEVYAKIQEIIGELQVYVDGTRPFTMVLDDPAGNSYIENPRAPLDDPKVRRTTYKRTAEQMIAMGFTPEDEEPAEELPFHEQIHSFPGNCSNCHAPCETKMHMLDIPHFKEVIIMAISCDACGYKSNEVKAGGAISAKGKRITLKMTDIEDLSRDILKSETCGLKIPEVDLELTSGTLGGRFTTIEGLLTQVLEELQQRSEFISGDSATDESKSRFEAFLGKLRKVLAMEINPVTLILDDPLANSHLQNPYAPDDDPNMTIEEYERSWEQNEVYGLNDIKIDGYQSDAADKPEADAAASELRVTYITPQNEAVTVEAREGTNLLDLAHMHQIDLEGACEGSLACSTCHLIVQDPAMYDKLEEPSDEENDMLDLAFGLTETSRLGCQIVMTKDLDGIVVRIPSATRNVQQAKLK
ncbi:nucleolar zinc-finger protein [Polyrhizophydium stewartii]|uniref:Nucleolar zinc-finger protein n=1 Tax=Polyrhizophydium stewartii TaxID=2732419 RepID=A0ABR4MYF9_9FUNG